VTERKLTPREEFDKGLRRSDADLRGEFERALAEHAAAFGVRPGEDVRARLGEYFEMVAAWNARLHLVAPCPPAEFAVRHVLESLLALRFIGEGAAVVDVGSGAGLPVVPCLVARPDIGGLLVESSQRKAVFLRETLAKLGRGESARVVAERFEKLEPPEADCLTCRALERFTEVLPHLVAWAARVPVLLLFGGESLRQRLEAVGLPFEAVRVPESERRFLFVIKKKG
jgi:16S rRNA (guanine527-N7)-methyltransferase